MNFNQITLCQAEVSEITFCKWSGGKLINDESLVVLRVAPGEAPGAQWQHQQSSINRGTAVGQC